MKKTVYAVLIRRGQEVKREELGNVNFDPFGRLTANQYNRLKRRITLKADRGEYVTLVTNDRQGDTFGGYPAHTYVYFK